MDVFLVQMEISQKNVAQNRDRVRQLIVPLDCLGGFVVLPEMFSTGFLTQEQDLGAELEDETHLQQDLDFLAALAREKRCHVLGSSIGRTPDRFSNLSLLFNPEGVLQARYQKIHPFSIGGEGRHFQGGENPKWTQVQGFHLFPTICYDLRFPELYRTGAFGGGDLLTVQANWPNARQEHWDILLRARAIENQAYVLGVNCVGRQGSLDYVGGSQVISPKGEVLAKAGSEETVVRASLEPGFAQRWRRQFPVLQDRKDWELYQKAKPETGDINIPE